jgi:hypothetical protein
MAIFERIDENQHGSHNLVMLSTVNRPQPTHGVVKTGTKPKNVTGGSKNSPNLGAFVPLVLIFNTSPC